MRTNDVSTAAPLLHTYPRLCCCMQAQAGAGVAGGQAPVTMEVEGEGEGAQVRGAARAIRVELCLSSRITGMVRVVPTMVGHELTHWSLTAVCADVWWGRRGCWGRAWAAPQRAPTGEIPWYRRLRISL
jgi:hypothetical protein